MFCVTEELQGGSYKTYGQKVIKKRTTKQESMTFLWRVLSKGSGQKLCEDENDVLYF